MNNSSSRQSMLYICLSLIFWIFWVRYNFLCLKKGTFVHYWCIWWKKCHYSCKIDWNKNWYAWWPKLGRTFSSNKYQKRFSNRSYICDSIKVKNTLSFRQQLLNTRQNRQNLSTKKPFQLLVMINEII